MYSSGHSRSFEVKADIEIPYGWAEKPRYIHYSQMRDVKTDYENLPQNIKNYFDEYMAHLNKIGVEKDKWENITNQVLAMLDSKSTLNAALKTYGSALEMYIPKDYLAKVKEKVERVPRAKKEAVEVDTDILIAAAVSHQMGN